MFHYFCFFQVLPAVVVVMDEQTGSPGGTAENNSQRNGEEVSIWPWISNNNLIY